MRPKKVLVRLSLTVLAIPIISIGLFGVAFNSPGCGFTGTTEELCGSLLGTGIYTSILVLGVLSAVLAIIGKFRPGIITMLIAFGMVVSVTVNRTWPFVHF